MGISTPDPNLMQMETAATPHPATTAAALQQEGIDRARAAAPADRWAHRSAGMRCSSCMFFVPKADTDGELGRCRRHAPTMQGFPVVYPVDWCGDHKLARATG